MRRRSSLAAVLAAVLACAVPSGAHAQDGSGRSGGGGSDPDPLSPTDAELATADSIRAAMEQPPGDHGGLSTADLVRVPFKALGASLAAVAGVGLMGYEILEEIGAVAAGRTVMDGLESVDVRVSPDFIGSRSWPALVLRWEGLDPFFVEGGYSLRRYELARAGLAFGDTLAGGEVAGAYRNMRELHFWGVGGDTPASDRSDYARIRREAGAAAWFPVLPGVGLRVEGAYEVDDVDRGFDDARSDLQDTFADDLPFGVTEETTYWRAGAAVDFDRRRVKGLNVSGVRVLGRWDLLRGADGTDSDFQRWQADARVYVPVTDRHILAFRGLGQDVFAEEGAGVPFHRLGELGDDDGLRGYTSRRFRGRAILAGTVEWRYEVWYHPGDFNYRLEGFAFVDHGAAGPSVDALDAGDFHTTPGLGIRFIDAGVGMAEAYLAFNGDESPRFDISLGTTF